jgi:hypothetical protein
MPMIPGRRALLAAPALLSACAFPERGPPVPAGDVRHARVLGLPNERFSPTDPDDLPLITEEFNAAGRRMRARFALGRGERLPDSRIIAFSGGGDNGAFGAGLACGWTEHGSRRDFNLVTGISTGALTAPLVFAGPHRDGLLRAAYTEIDGTDVLRPRWLLSALTHDAVADSTPLANLIARFFDEDLLADIARGYRDGRQLVVGTTNLDAQRPVGWNLGAIAASGHPDALALCRRILLASASIPGVFPPVLFDVTAGGRRYQEMHVDGGAFAQAYLFPPALGATRAARVRAGLSPEQVTAYVVLNARIAPRGRLVERRTVAIASRAISTLIGSSGINDVHRIASAAAGAPGIAFRVAYIEPEFTMESDEPFAREYMRALFQYGFERARAGDPWRTALPV